MCLLHQPLGLLTSLFVIRELTGNRPSSSPILFLPSLLLTYSSCLSLPASNFLLSLPFGFRFFGLMCSSECDPEGAKKLWPNLFFTEQV